MTGRRLNRALPTPLVPTTSSRSLQPWLRPYTFHLRCIREFSTKAAGSGEASSNNNNNTGADERKEEEEETAGDTKKERTAVKGRKQTETSSMSPSVGKLR